MAEHALSSLAMLTEFFTAEHIEASARRTGFVQRAAKVTGKLFLALVTFGLWSDATATLAPLAAKVTQLDEQLEVSPEAIHQRMNKRAHAFLQDMLRQVLAKVQAIEQVCDDGLFTYFTKVYLADSTGFALAESLHDVFPGSGGSAGKAGAKIQAVWDYKSSVFGHFALTPWNIPDQKYIDHVVELAQKGVLFIFDLGYFKLKALARIAATGAYFLSRLNHQTNLLVVAAGRVQPLELAPFLKTVESNCIEQAVFLGTKERVASRLVAIVYPSPSSMSAGESQKRRPRRKAMSHQKLT